MTAYPDTRLTDTGSEIKVEYYLSKRFPVTQLIKYENVVLRKGSDATDNNLGFLLISDRSKDSDINAERENERFNGSDRTSNYVDAIRIDVNHLFSDIPFDDVDSLMTSINEIIDRESTGAPGEVGYVTMTSPQFRTAVLGSTLPINVYVKVTNIGVDNLEVKCWTISSSTFNPNVEVLNYDCDSGYMYLEPQFNLVTVKCTDEIYGVVRNNSGTWELITTGGHTSHRVSTSSVSNLPTGDGPRITFQKTDYSDAGTAMSGIDDTYVNSFAFVGAAGGLQYADMPLTRSGSIKANVYYSGGTWQKVGPDAAIISVATVGLYCLITHPACETGSGNATTGAELYCYTPCMSSGSPTSTRIGFRDGNAQITVPGVFQSNFLFQRFYEKKFINAESAVVNSNIWFFYKMHKIFN